MDGGTVLLGLAPGRGSLARLRQAPLVALCVLAAGDVAVTARGRATVVADPLPGAEPVVAVRLDVEAVDEHGTARTVVDGGPRWRWVDPEAAERDARVRAALARLAAGG